MIDTLFLTITLLVMALVAFGARWLSMRAYSWMLFACIVFSVGLIVVFNEYEVEAQGNSPLHSSLMALCQYGALTLSAKIWFSIIYPKLYKFQRVALSLILIAALIGLVVASYSLKTNAPLAAILLYPVASISLALIAESIEAFLHQKNSQQAALE